MVVLVVVVLLLLLLPPLPLLLLLLLLLLQSLPPLPPLLTLGAGDYSDASTKNELLDYLDIGMTLIFLAEMLLKVRRLLLLLVLLVPMQLLVVMPPRPPAAPLMSPLLRCWRWAWCGTSSAICAPRGTGWTA